MATKGLVQQAVWRKRGCCLVGHFAGFWEFFSRPSLTDTPACPKLLKRCTQADDSTRLTNRSKLNTCDSEARQDLRSR